MVPSVSILAEPSVAVVDKVVDKHGTRKVAEAYLKYLYSPEGQTIAAKHYYRPRDVEGGARRVPEAISQGRIVHDRRRVRRLGEGPARAFRRRRRVRPDLSKAKL